MKADVPNKVRPFASLGVELRPPRGEAGDWCGDCPFCGKERHLYVAKDGRWDCKRCGVSGNVLTFLTLVADALEQGALDELVESRGLPAGALRRWEVGRWDVTGEWAIPVRNEKGTVVDLRRWRDGRMRSTGGCRTGLLGVDRLREGTPVWVCEGEWDAMALDWLLRRVGIDVDVVAVPGANVFKEGWLDHFKGKDVVLAYDADVAGEDGAQRAASRLEGVASRVRIVKWPTFRPSGWDVRDHVLSRRKSPRRAWRELGEMLMDVGRRGPEAETPDRVVDPDLVRRSVATFEEHVHMSDDLRAALRIAWAVALSIDLPGDPLWLYLVGPPGSGKTMILQSFARSTRCVMRSTLTPHGLVSGWRSGGDKDPSLIPQLRGKTLIAKDFTEVLALPYAQQEEVFSTLRGAYDGSVFKSFGNGIERRYDDCRFSLLAGVTHAVHAHDRASLGERFLRLRVGPVAEDERHVISAAIGSIGKERKIEESLCDATSAVLAAGIDVDQTPAISDRHRDRFMALVRLVARIRASVERDRYRGDVLYRPQPEVGTRIAKQLGKLMISLAAIRGASETNDEDYRIMERVATNTVGGYHLDIVRVLAADEQVTRADIVERADIPSSTLVRQLDDLETLKIVRRIGKAKKGRRTGRPPVQYVLDDEVRDLWNASHNGLPESGTSWNGSARRRRRRSRS